MQRCRFSITTAAPGNLHAHAAGEIERAAGGKGSRFDGFGRISLREQRPELASSGSSKNIKARRMAGMVVFLFPERMELGQLESLAVLRDNEHRRLPPHGQTSIWPRTNIQKLRIGARWW
jgi:hypothetical protein